MRFIAAAACVALGLTAGAVEAQTIRVFANSAHQDSFAGKPGATQGNLQAEFEKTTGLRIVWDTVPWPQMRQNFQRALASSSGAYDVVMVINEWATPDVLAKLLPLDAMTPALEEPADIFPAMRQTFTHAGKLVGLPIRSNPQIVHFNKTIFAERGIAQPRSFAELLDAAQKLGGKRADGASVYGFGVKSLGDDDLTLIMKALGGDVLTRDYEVVVDSPANAATLARLKALYESGGIAPNFASMDTVAVQNLMREGLLAMVLFGDSYYTRFNDPKTSRVAGHVGYFAIPGAKDGAYGPAKVAYWAAALPANGPAANREAAWKFIQFMASKSAQLQMAVNGNGPARRSTLEDPRFQKDAPYAADSAIALANAAEIFPVFDGSPQVQAAFTEEAVLAITGRKPIADALRSASDRIKAIVAEKRPK
jgi:multiple sugar transport system substrate-binding protein